MRVVSQNSPQDVPTLDADTRYAAEAIVLYMRAETPELNLPERFGRYTELITETLAVPFAAYCANTTMGPDAVSKEMRTLWERIRDDPGLALAKLKATVEAADAAEVAQRNGSVNGDGQSATGSTIDAKPVIEISTDITAMVDATQAAIEKLPTGPYLFQRVRQLSHITRTSTPPRWLRRPLDTPLIYPIDPACLRELATLAATWQKFDKRADKWDPALPPMFVIETLYARPSWTFPPLEGIVCAPTLWPDGSVFNTLGYEVVHQMCW